MDISGAVHQAHPSLALVLLIAHRFIVFAYLPQYPSSSATLEAEVSPIAYFY